MAKMTRNIKQLRIEMNKRRTKIYAVKSDRADNKTLKLYYASLSNYYSAMLLN